MMFELDIPPRFRCATLDSYAVTQPGQEVALRFARAYVERWEGRKANGAGLFFIGNPGTGKTHLAYGIARALEEKGEIVKVTTAGTMAKQIRESRRWDSSMTEADTIQFFAAFDLLVLDEVGVGQANEADRVAIFEVVNRRYNLSLPTIVISNLSTDEIGAVLGVSTTERLLDGASVISFGWPTHRAVPAAKNIV